MFKKMYHLITGREDKKIQQYKDEVSYESLKTSRKLDRALVNKDTVYYIGKVIGGI
jgi:hypothetical protein